MFGRSPRELVTPLWSWGRRGVEDGIETRHPLGRGNLSCLLGLQAEIPSRQQDMGIRHAGETEEL